MGEHRLRLGVLIASLAALGIGVAVNPATGVAQATASSTETLTPKYLSGPTQDIWPASSSFAMGPAVLEAGVGYRYIWRVADGAVSRRVRVTSTTDRAGLLRISGDHAIWDRTIDGRRTITAENLQTGQKSAIRVPYEQVLTAHPGWVLAANPGASPIEIHLLRANGTDDVVATVDSPHVNAGGSDPAAAIFRGSWNDSPSQLLDIATGTVQEVPGPTLTPNRVFRLVANGSATTATWVGRSALDETHTVAVQAPRQQLTTLGDDLVAAVPSACGQAACPSDLHIVDLETGQLGEPIVNDVVRAWGTGDRSLKLKLAGGPAGRYAVLDPGDEQPHVFAELPRELARPLTVDLSGARVVARWQDVSPGHLHEFTAGEWSEVRDPATEQPMPAMTAQLGGDVLLAQVGNDIDGTSDDRWRVVWPGGTRDIVTSGSVELGRRGNLLSVRTNEGYDVQDARTGQVLRSTTTRPALQGTWIWLVEGGDLMGRDTAQPAAAKRVRIASYCADPWLGDVRDQRAMVNCRADGWRVSYLVDVRGSLKPVYLGSESWELGNGFLFRSEFLADGDYLVYAQNFPDGAPRRLVARSKTRAVVDDASSRRLAYADQFGRVQLRTIELPDRTPPRLLARGGSPRVLITSTRAGSVRNWWRYADPQTAGEEPAGGVTGYDYRYRTRDTARASWNAWRSDFTRGTSKALSTPSGRTVCFQVRARDAYLNVSPWTTARCTSVDGDRPRVWPGVRDVGRRIRLQFWGADDSGIASYRVQYRYGPSKAWIKPAKWAALPVWREQVFVDSVRGRRVCFRISAVDKVGRRGPWRTPSCTPVLH